jgi:hypothetical protein
MTLKHHTNSNDKHNCIIETLQLKVEEQGAISNPLVEVLMGILLSKKRDSQSLMPT